MCSNAALFLRTTSKSCETSSLTAKEKENETYLKKLPPQGFCPKKAPEKSLLMQLSEGRFGKSMYWK